jgi:hypothetical protein
MSTIVISTFDSAERDYLSPPDELCEEDEIECPYCVFCDASMEEEELICYEDDCYICSKCLMEQDEEDEDASQT